MNIFQLICKYEWTLRTFCNLYCASYESILYSSFSSSVSQICFRLRFIIVHNCKALLSIPICDVLCGYSLVSHCYSPLLYALSSCVPTIARATLPRSLSLRPNRLIRRTLLNESLCVHYALTVALQRDLRSYVALWRLWFRDLILNQTRIQWAIRTCSRRHVHFSYISYIKTVDDFPDACENPNRCNFSFSESR